jgi:Ca-activated chloride channel family protein
VRNTELDEAALLSIADKTGGRYFRARDIAGLEEIYQLLDELEPVSKEEELFRPVHELYMWPLAAAMLLSMLLAVASSALFTTRIRREVGGD